MLYALLLACLAAGCETEQKVMWRVLFACEQAAQDVVLVRTRILRNGCDGEPIYEAELPRGGEQSAAGPPGKLPPGSYGFEATSLDSLGAVVSKACRVFFPEGHSQVEVVLSSASCTAGTSDVLDAGVIDAGVDTGTSYPIADAGGDDKPDATDGCLNDPAKEQPGVCGCGIPEDDRNADGTPDCIDKDAGVEPPEESTIFVESFESPDVESWLQRSPTGWMAVGHPSYFSIFDEAVGTFVTPHGQQAFEIFRSAPPSAPSSLTTTASNLNAVLEAERIYTLTFHVARHNDRLATGYVVEVLAISDQTGIETVLDSASGSAVETSDMTRSDRIVFITGPSHASLGQRIAIRLMKAPGADGTSNPLFDEVRLTVRRIAR